MNLDRRRRGSGRYGRTHPRRLEAGMGMEGGRGSSFFRAKRKREQVSARQPDPRQEGAEECHADRARLEAKGRAVLASPFHSDYSGINHISVGEAP